LQELSELRSENADLMSQVEELMAQNDELNTLAQSVIDERDSFMSCNQSWETTDDGTALSSY
jgi:pheromone shutdown protein TraB